MSIFKIITWLSLYFIIYILFSLNTLISIFCFIIVIFLISVLLFILHIEYLTFLLLLLYLGGILIFFLFTALMLNNEYTTLKSKTYLSFHNILLLILTLKMFFIISILNYRITEQQNYCVFDYFSTHINNQYFITNILSNQSDISIFSCLFTEKYILLFILGNVLLFTMVGVIVITKK